MQANDKHPLRRMDIASTHTEDADFIHRILHAAYATPRGEAAAFSLREWLFSLIPAPALVLPSLVVLGIAIGLYSPVQTAPDAQTGASMLYSSAEVL